MCVSTVSLYVSYVFYRCTNIGLGNPFGMV